VDSADFEEEGSSRRESAATDQPREKGIEPKSSIKVDRIEAKTLSLCVKTLTTLLNTDIQNFVDFPLNERISLFKQIACITDLSHSLLPCFKARTLNMHHEIYDSRNQSGSQYFHAH
jgi:hypothetical protein